MVNKKEIKLQKALNKLRELASSLNGEWKKDTKNTGYFLSAIKDYSFMDSRFGFEILEHNEGKYPGVVYFQSPEMAYKALDTAYIEGWLNDLR